MKHAMFTDSHFLSPHHTHSAYVIKSLRREVKKSFFYCAWLQTDIGLVFYCVFFTMTSWMLVTIKSTFSNPWNWRWFSVHLKFTSAGLSLGFELEPDRNFSWLISSNTMLLYFYWQTASIYSVLNWETSYMFTVAWWMDPPAVNNLPSLSFWPQTGQIQNVMSISEPAGLQMQEYVIIIYFTDHNTVHLVNYTLSHYCPSVLCVS